MRELLTFACAALVLLSACSRPTEVTSEWVESRAAAGPYDGVLIVGVTESGRQRRRFENTVATKLESAGATAWASNQVMPDNAESNRETVAAAVRETGATAVVVTRLVNQEISSKEIQGRTQIKTNSDKEKASDFFNYDYDEYEEGNQLELRSTVAVSTDVYEAADGKLVYSMRATVFDKQTDFEILDDLTTAIANRLRKDRITR